MPTIKHSIRPRSLAELRQERDQAEEWLRGTVEGYIEDPTHADASDIAEDLLPRYREAFARVRAAERRKIQETKP